MLGFHRNLHTCSNTLVLTWLAKLSDKKTGRKEAIDLLTLIFRHLFTEMIGDEFPQQRHRVTTRMGARLTTDMIDAKVPVTIVDLVRAGIRPTLILHELLLQSGIIDEDLVHEHHVIAARESDEAGHVKGVKTDFSKADEAVKPGSILVIPDPMLATGTTISAVITRYNQLWPTEIAKIIVVSLIAAPEGVEEIHRRHPEVKIYVGRVDHGLTDKGYIVPGAGGLGELMTGTQK
jgi:uracil phosphoribosyltransferase